MNFPDLEGERIRLIEINEGGFEGMYQYSCHPALYEFLEIPPHRTAEDTRAYLNKLLGRSRSETAHYWFIVLKEGNKIIGTFGLQHVDRRKGLAEIGYGLSPDYWGQGFFQEALATVLKQLFVGLQFHRVSAITAWNNHPSIKGLEKAGFKREGCLRDYYLSYDGRRFDAMIYGLLGPEYRERL